MPLHMTKVAYGCTDIGELESWFCGSDPEKRLTTRYVPKRQAEMVGGSLFWVLQHTLVARSPILRFDQKEDGRWWIVLGNELILVHPRPRRAHQGWRYLKDEDAPQDMAAGEVAGDALPSKVIRELAKLGLV